jgi:hypothetical protein
MDDATLTDLALAADPDAAIDDDAAPFLPWMPEGEPVSDTDLPAWYMPPVGVVAPKRWHRVAGWLIVSAMVVIPAFGFCITYGSLVLAGI